MSAPPLTPAEAARTLWQIGLDIEAATATLLAARKKLPQLIRDRRLAYARAFLSAEGTLDVRKQTAELAADAAKFAVDSCEQEIEGLKDQLKELRDRSEIGRSINSNLKEELRTLPGGA